jgi:epoxyqueuosine reductase
MEIGRQIVQIAIDNGASLAGIASAEALRASPAHAIYPKMDHYGGIGTVKNDDTLSGDQLFQWPHQGKSVLVIGLSHPKNKPELDWWDGKGTPGNRMLIDIMKRTRHQIEESLKLSTRRLHYYVEKGGAFLKDAAVLAGFGCIGKNNLLVTPSYGPRIRLRASLLDAEIAPDGPVFFDPCQGCKVYCRKVCPEKAMDNKLAFFERTDGSIEIPGRDGTYDRDKCNIRMEKDIRESKDDVSGKQAPVKYCRKCEFVCPVGRR